MTYFIGQMALLIGLGIFYGWRYCNLDTDPDWAFFNLYAFTGSLYGRDFPDCKTPGVHIYYWLLSKLVGKNIPAIKFANHFILSLAAIPIWYLSGNFFAALAYIVLVNSGWLLTFHGNVGQVPAALIAIALLSPSPVAVVLWLAAVFYEPKLLPAFVAIAAISLWWWLIPIGIAAIIPLYFMRNQQWFKWIWESSVIIPARMQSFRKKQGYYWWMPWWTANGTLYIAPWLIMAVIAKPDFLYWLPPLLFVGFLMTGIVVRQNHLIPVIPWIVLSGMSPVTILALCSIDWVSAGFYMGHIWRRFYPYIENLNRGVEECGSWLRQKAGTIYVMGIHSGIYLASGKHTNFGLTEEIEIRDVATERRKAMLEAWKKNPPDWVVLGDTPGLNFEPRGYMKVAEFGDNIVFEKIGAHK